MTSRLHVLRQPKGPDPDSRGFPPREPPSADPSPTIIPASTTSEPAPSLQEEQSARAELRCSFLRCLTSMTNKKIQFHMYGNVKVEARFGASDIDVLNFQVSELQTVIGLYKEALLRCQDVISFSFDV